MDDLIIVAFFIWVSLILAGYIFKKWEIQIIDALLGFYLALHSIETSFPIGVFLFGINLWILFEALREAK